MLVDASAIQAKIASDTERMRALGITEEDVRDYYNSLAPEGDEPAHDHAVFTDFAQKHKLSEADQAFVKRVLDEGDSR